MTGKTFANSLPLLSLLLFLESLCYRFQSQVENISSVLTKSLRTAGKSLRISQIIGTLPSGTKLRIGCFCGK